MCRRKCDGSDDEDVNEWFPDKSKANNEVEGLSRQKKTEKHAKYTDLAGIPAG